MAKSDTFRCNVITPESAVLECDAQSVVFPAHDGELGVLPKRAPLICKLGIGVLRIQTADEKHALFVDGGFAQITGNQLTLLTDQARQPDDLDVSAVEQNLVEARAMRITDDASLTARTRALRRAQIQLRMAKERT